MPILNSEINVRSLRLTTALSTTLLLAGFLSPAPAIAQAVIDRQGETSPVTENNNLPCVSADDCIIISTTGDDNFIDLTNSGALTADEDGIDTLTDGDDAGITINNTGGIDAGQFGIAARTEGENSPILIENSGNITAAGNEPGDGTGGGSANPFDPLDPLDPFDFSDGIYAMSEGQNSPVAIVNSGDISVGGGFVPIPEDPTHSRGNYDGIYAVTSGGDSSIVIVNGGHLTTTYGEAIDVRTYGAVAPVRIPANAAVPDEIKVGPHNSSVTIINYGEITSGDDGIEVCTAGLRNTNCRGGGGDSPVTIVNFAEINANYVSIDAVTYGSDSPITFYNFADVSSGEESLDAETSGDDSPIRITNTGNVVSGIDGISAATSAYAQGNDSPIAIFNTGDLVTGEAGIYANTGQNFPSDQSPISIYNSGNIVAGLNAAGNPEANGAGIFAHTYGFSSSIAIDNRGDIDNTAAADFAGIYAVTEGEVIEVAVGVDIYNAGNITTGQSGISVRNTGDINGKLAGIRIVNTGVITPGGGASEIDITNEGTLAAQSRLTIQTQGAAATINNSGAIFGIVDIEDLDEFNNSGLIIMKNGVPGEEFLLPGDFNASGESKLVVDARLGPGRASDRLVIEGGDVTGETKVNVNNTSRSGGVANQTIPVVTVTGTVEAGKNSFVLGNGPLDAGFFNYDLFCDKDPCDEDVAFELKSFAGPGAFLLPQLVTANQDIWHITSDVWFDRTADLRAVLRGTGENVASLKDGSAATGPGRFAPGAWARASAGWLDRDDTAHTSLKDRRYTFDLAHELQVRDIQAGYDIGQRDILSPGDAVVLGVLGGAVDGKLDYDAVRRRFEFSGGQVGAYATYLDRSLFVDALVKADFLEIDAETPGFRTIDAQTIGVRLDTGYRFSASGLFAEPLATVAAAWTSMDDIAGDPNSVHFDDAASVRGRLGLRLGATLAWKNTTIEPFLIGSVWREFDGENEARLTSSGDVLKFSDNPDKTWGQVSGGVNLFNASGVAAFAKADVTFGNNIEGFGGQVGVRITSNPFAQHGEPEGPDTERAAKTAGASAADLEERVAELEATTARSGNRYMRLTISGAEDRAVLYWDDESENDAYVVANDAEGPKVDIAGEVRNALGTGWSAGFLIETGIHGPDSSDVSQTDDDGEAERLQIEESHVWVGHDSFGKLTWGQVGGSDDVDDATEVDISETSVASYAGVEDIGGNFFLRRVGVKGEKGLTAVTWGDLIDHMPGVDGNLVRYDSPVFQGWSLSAEWGEDDAWETALTFASEPDAVEDEEGPKFRKSKTAGIKNKTYPQSAFFKNFELVGTISYAEFIGDEAEQEGFVENSQISGSASILHKPTGLNLTIAAGHRFNQGTALLNDGTFGTPKDPGFYYFKPGLLLDLTSLGHTGFYTEYGKWWNFLGRDASAEAVGGLAGIDETVVCTQGEACLVSDSDATIWGLGVVQHIDNAGMQAYLGYRHYEANVNLLDANGGKSRPVPLTDFATVIGGVLVEF